MSVLQKLTPQQRLAFHLLHQLVLPFTRPSDRATALQVLREQQAALGGEDLALLRAAVSEVLAARTPVDWAMARNTAERALVPFHVAEACALIAGLSARRVA